MYRTPVSSTNIRSIGYDPQSAILEVEFISGDVYQYRNDIPKLIELWNGGEPKVAKHYSWFTTVKEIADNDYILSANTYSPYNGEEETNHRDPKEILGEIREDEKKLGSALNKMGKLL